MQSDATIRRAAMRLDRALESADVEAVVACFDPQCTIELLGVRLDGHTGVRRWVDWIYEQVDSVVFAPRFITVDGDTLVEEFEVRAALPGGNLIRSGWVEVLTYRADLVTGLRLYFNPIDFASAVGSTGRMFGPIATRMARKGLEPFTEIAG